MVGRPSFQSVFTFESLANLMTSHTRESLIFEEGWKENLLKNIEVSLKFARCQVDPLQVTKNGKL